MLKSTKSIIKFSKLAMITVIFLFLFSKYSLAEDANSEQSGDGWNISADGVMTIESNQGWANCLKDGFEDNVRELIIGKDVTNFRMYDLPYDVPTEDFFGPKDLIGYSSLGNPIYDFKTIEGLFPSEIIVEDGNSVFRVINGLLINTETQELVLSEMGVEDVVIPDGIKKITKDAFCNRNLITVKFPSSLQSIGSYAFAKCESLRSVDLPDSLTREYIVNPYTKKNKTFGLSSVETVIFSGSDYDFGYPAISHAHNVYFLGKPPKDVGQILDENSVESIFCSDEFEFEWTRSTVASWVRQRLTILPAEQLKEITDQEINATPSPTDMPRPTPRPTETPWPTPMPRPTASPAVTAKPQQQGTDPLVFAFAGILALIIAGIVVVAVKSRPNNRKRRRKHV